MSVSLSWDYAAIIREMIRHENDLVNHRLTWLCQIQGFLFTALGVSFTNDLCHNAHIIRPILIGIGISVSISSFVGLKMSGLAISELIKKFNNQCPNNFSPPIIGLDMDDKKKNEDGSSNVSKDRYWSFLQFFLPWRILPILFILAWIFVALFLYIHIDVRQECLS
jgi:hypothetical protein